MVCQGFLAGKVEVAAGYWQLVAGHSMKTAQGAQSASRRHTRA